MKDLLKPKVGWSQIFKMIAFITVILASVWLYVWYQISLEMASKLEIRRLFRKKIWDGTDLRHKYLARVTSSGMSRGVDQRPGFSLGANTPATLRGLTPGLGQGEILIPQLLHFGIGWFRRHGCGLGEAEDQHLAVDRNVLELGDNDEH